MIKKKVPEEVIKNSKTSLEKLIINNTKTREAYNEITKAINKSQFCLCLDVYSL